MSRRFTRNFRAEAEADHQAKAARLAVEEADQPDIRAAMNALVKNPVATDAEVADHLLAVGYRGSDLQRMALAAVARRGLRVATER